MADDIVDDKSLTDEACDMPELVEKIYSSFEYADSERPSVINLLFANPGENMLHEKAAETRVTFPWIMGEMSVADKKDAILHIANNEITVMMPLGAGVNILPDIENPVNTVEEISAFDLSDTNEVEMLSKSENVVDGKGSFVRYIYDPITGQRRAL